MVLPMPHAIIPTAFALRKMATACTPKGLLFESRIRVKTRAALAVEKVAAAIAAAAAIRKRAESAASPTKHGNSHLMPPPSHKADLKSSFSGCRSPSGATCEHDASSKATQLVAVEAAATASRTRAALAAEKVAAAMAAAAILRKRAESAAAALKCAQQVRLSSATKPPTGQAQALVQKPPLASPRIPSEMGASSSAGYKEKHQMVLAERMEEMRKARAFSKPVPMASPVKSVPKEDKKNYDDYETSAAAASGSCDAKPASANKGFGSPGRFRTATVKTARRYSIVTAPPRKLKPYANDSISTPGPSGLKVAAHKAIHGVNAKPCAPATAASGRRAKVPAMDAMMGASSSAGDKGEHQMVFSKSLAKRIEEMRKARASSKPAPVAKPATAVMTTAAPVASPVKGELGTTPAEVGKSSSEEHRAGIGRTSAAAASRSRKNEPASANKDFGSPGRFRTATAKRPSGLKVAAHEDGVNAKPCAPATVASGGSTKVRVMDAMMGASSSAGDKGKHQMVFSKSLAKRMEEMRKARAFSKPATVAKPATTAVMSSRAPVASPVMGKPEPESGEDGEEEDPFDMSSTPDWARGDNLANILDRQFGGPKPLNPDKIFPEVPTCNLEHMFNTNNPKWDRTSSVDWDVGRPTIAERIAYNREMGYQE